MGATILFVGMDDVNVSIGMALAETEYEVTRLGFDPDKKVARAAKKAGAVERIVRPEQEVENATIVIMGYLGDQMREYMELLAPNMTAGTVVVDTSPFKSATASWVDEVLPESCSYVGILPAVNFEVLLTPISQRVEPSCDMYRGGLLGVILSPSAPEEALNAALNLAAVIGATPFFIEAEESDAAQAAVELIPALVGTALLQVASKDPGWRNVQRLAGRNFANATALYRDVSAETMSGNVDLGRDFVIAKLDAVLERLKLLRDSLADEQDETMLNQLSEANEAYVDWLRARQRRQWDGEEADSASITRATMLGSFLGYDPQRHKRRE